MKNFTYSCILVFLSLLLMTGCPDKADDNEHILIRNKLDKNIFVCIRIEQSGGPCPDTSLPYQKSGHIIEKGETDMIYFAPPTCDTIRIFILDVNTLNTYSWDQIRNENNILKRYDLKIIDLKKLNWIITYP